MWMFVDGKFGCALFVGMGVEPLLFIIPATVTV